MKKYSLEEIENLDQEAVLEIAKAMVESKFQPDQYSLNELKHIFDKIRQGYEHSICKSASKIFNHEITEEQLEALKEVFLAAESKEWLRCRSALEVFFEYEDPMHLRELDLSEVDYRDIVNWYKMLFETGLCDEPEESSVRIFYELILDEFLDRMPKEGELLMRKGLKMFFPELVEGVVIPDIQ